MTLQALNLSVVLIWLLSAYLSKLYSLSVLEILSVIVAWFVVFILSGTSLAYTSCSFLKKNSLSSNIALLFSVGIICSLFLIPLLLFTLNISFPLDTPLLLVSAYVIFLLIPLLRPKLHLSENLSPTSRLSALRHPITIALIIIFLVQSLALSQFSFLPGLDTYTLLMTYESKPFSQLYELSSGVNRILLSTLIATFQRLSNATYFNIFKYWFPLVSLLSVVPLWLLARSIKNKRAQLIVLLTPLITPSVILDFTTTRHQVILQLFLYLALGLLFTAYKYNRPSLLWLTFLTSLAGALYHPLFLIITVILALAALFSIRHLILRHPLLSILFIFLFFKLTYSLHLTFFLNNVRLRFEPIIQNIFSLRWNLIYPTQFISEGVQMGWPGIGGVLKFYGYYCGPLTAIVLFCFLFSLLISKPFRQRAFRYTFSPYLFPLLSFGLLLFFLAEIIPRLSYITYLPDRAWTLISFLTPLLLVLLFKSFSKIAGSYLFTTASFFLITISVAGAIHVNQTTAYTIPDFEFEAASWINDNLPTDRYFFTSSSKNILRYYARSKLLSMPPETITSDNADSILSTINKQRPTFKDSPIFIYYAVTDPRNPFVDRPYASSFTKARPDSLFPALNSHPSYFNLIYHQPGKVYIWHIKSYE
jgi:hypothetical protein